MMIKKKNDNINITLRGIPASPGIAIGKIRVLDEEKIIIPKIKIKKDEIPNEIKRYEEALDKTKDELRKLQDKFNKAVKNDELDFFKVHIMIVEDPYLKESVIREIAEKLKNAEWALYTIMEKHIKTLQQINDEYLSERVADLYDISRRIMKYLLNKGGKSLAELQKQVIIVAKDLSPTDTADLDKEKILGFVTELGGRTSHTAIVSRALEIPAVVGIQKIVDKVKDDDIAIIDGNNGIVIINPNETTLREYKTAKSIFDKYAEELKQLKYLDAITLDKKKFVIAGNIEIREEIDSVISHGGMGIGLFRTEFLYLNKSKIPSEDELFQIFKEAVEKLHPYPVVFRTLDIGGDKVGDVFQITNEINPFLGYRAIRFCLENPDIFYPQIRAILKASYYGNGKIMFPMISSVDEVKRVKKIIEEIKMELRDKNENFKEDIEIGAMIEIPSAAVTIDIIAKEVDFVSIGTNDLVQYTLAVDRNNPKISYLYEPFHPAVLRLINQVVKTAHKNKIKVHICGELSADPMAVLLFVGMKVDELSMSAIAIPEIKKIIRSIKFSDAKLLLNEILKLKTATEIKEHIRAFIKHTIPEYLYKNI